MNPLKAKPMRRGDAVSVVAPAGPLNRQRIERALVRFQAAGFRTKTYGDIFRARGYLAGDDATRAQELMEAFADPDSTAVWCARGGYGVVRLLDRLDFDVIRRHPKVFVGFSDITALHLAIQKRVGLITFHGPNLQDGFGQEDELPQASQAAVWRAILAEKSDGAGQGYLLAVTGEHALKTLSPGVATGRLTGGNLAVLCGLMGTPYEIETAGRILFIEDVDEAPYRIDRYLAQLSLAGKLRATAGIVLGGFTFDDPVPEGTQAKAVAVLREYCEPLGIPVVAGFPAGHQRENLTLPIGAMVELDADSLRVKLCENSVASG